MINDQPAKPMTAEELDEVEREWIAGGGMSGVKQPTLVEFLKDSEIVHTKNADGQKAVLIRVYYPGGWFVDHKVSQDEDRPRP